MKQFCILAFCLVFLFLASQTVSFAQTFVSTQSDLFALCKGNAIWGDVNNDGYLDIFITGTAETGVQAELYLNKTAQGQGFKMVSGSGFMAVYDGQAKFFDYNNDGHLDIILTGSVAANDARCLIYENSGTETFTLKEFKIEGLSNSSVDCGDFNNDGFVDFAIGGMTKDRKMRTMIYENQKGKGFQFVDFGLEGIRDGAIAWVDFDGDGLLDISLTGNGKTRLYRNAGNAFIDINAQIPGLYKSTLAWCDYNNDGLPDLAITGSLTGSHTGLFAMLYLNTNGSTFIDEYELTPLWNGASIAWGDFDNDDLPDLAMAGDVGVQRRVFKLLRNGSTRHETKFHNVTTALFTVFDEGSIAFGDYDRDGALDILYTGRRSGMRAVADVMRNTSSLKSYEPLPPVTLKSYQNGDNVILTWIPSPDTFAYTHNLKMGINTGKDEVVTPQISEGRRKLPDFGNLGDAMSYTVRNLIPNQEYFWSIQAVSKSFKGSKFAPENTFKLAQGLPELTSLSMTQDANMIVMKANVSSVSGVTEMGFLYAFTRAELFANPKTLSAAAGEYPEQLLAKTPILQEFDNYYAIPFVKTASGTSYGTQMHFLYPQPPVVKPIVMYCKGKPAKPLTAEGEDLRWYSTEYLYDPMPKAPVPSTKIENKSYYWVTQTVDGVESDRAQIIVHVSERAPEYYLKNTKTFERKQNVIFLPNSNQTAMCEWTLPQGWFGKSLTNSIAIHYGATSGDGIITVVAKNGCGESQPVELNISQTGGGTSIQYTTLKKEEGSKKEDKKDDAKEAKKE